MNYKFDSYGCLIERGSTIAKIRGNDVQDSRYQNVGKIDGDVLKDSRYTIVAKLDGNVVKNSRGDKIADLASIQKLIEGHPGKMEAVALWYFFIR